MTTTTERPEPLLTSAEAATFLGCSTRTLQRLKTAGVLRYVPEVGLGGQRPRVRFRRADLVDYLERRQAEGIPERRSA